MTRLYIEIFFKIGVSIQCFRWRPQQLRLCILHCDVERMKTTNDLYFQSLMYSSKTKIVWLVLKKNSSEVFHHSRWKLYWGSTSFNLLGIEFSGDLDKITSLNYGHNSISFITLKPISMRGSRGGVRGVRTPPPPGICKA